MKKMLIISFVSIFLTTNVYAADCSDYKTFSHKWNMCKLGNLGNASSNKPDNKPEKKGKIGNFLQKIKNYGGENIGEPG